MPFSTIASESNRQKPLNPEIKLCNLPPFSPAAARLMQLAGGVDADVKTVLPIFHSDPALAADVLRLANSPLFAVRNEVRSIQHAVVFLGLERIKALAAAIAMRRYSTGSDASACRQCWEHSLACAVIAEELAEPCGLRREDAYTAGLLHDIGRVGLLKAYSQEYLPVLRCTYERLDENLSLERSVLTIDHCQSGSVLTKVWAFPRPLQTTAEQHHSADGLDSQSLVNVVRTACIAADALGFAEVNYPNEAGMDTALRFLDPAIAKQFLPRVSFLEKRTREKIAYFST